MDCWPFCWYFARWVAAWRGRRDNRVTAGYNRSSRTTASTWVRSHRTLYATASSVSPERVCKTQCDINGTDVHYQPLGWIGRDKNNLCVFWHSFQNIHFFKSANNYYEKTVCALLICCSIQLPIDNNCIAGCLYSTAIVQTSFCYPEKLISEDLVASYSHGLTLSRSLLLSVSLL